MPNKQALINIFYKLWYIHCVGCTKHDTIQNIYFLYRPPRLFGILSDRWVRHVWAVALAQLKCRRLV